MSPVKRFKYSVCLCICVCLCVRACVAANPPSSLSALPVTEPGSVKQSEVTENAVKAGVTLSWLNCFFPLQRVTVTMVQLRLSHVTSMFDTEDPQLNKKRQ